VVDLNESVPVPTTYIPLNDHQMETMMSLVDPLSACDDHGVTFYVAVRAFVHTLIQ
jgi:hypothetical protein